VCTSGIEKFSVAQEIADENHLIAWHRPAAPIDQKIDRFAPSASRAMPSAGLVASESRISLMLLSVF
jgi:methionyl-tRNA formyltransferase